MQKIRAHANSKGLKIYCIGGVQDACDKFIDCNPFQVIAYFQHADCVVTDTFHGTILSVITHRQFASVVRKTGYGNAEKMTDLLARLRLSDRIVDDLDKVGDKVEEPIDYEQVDEIIQIERERSYKYVEGNIDAK